MKKWEFKIPTLVGLAIVIGGLVSGLWLVQKQLSQSGKAAADSAPENVVVANVTDSSFSVSWTTQKAISGYVQYGEGINSPDLVVSDDRDQQKGAIDNYFTHFVSIKGLKPDTNYKFKIGSGSTISDQGGVAYEIKTGVSLSNQPAADVAYGQVVTTSGDPAEGAIIYLQIPGGNIQAALVKASGSWVMPLATIRSSDLTGFINYDKEATRIDLSVDAGPMGKAHLVTTTANDSPVPEIALGEDKNLTAAEAPATNTESTGSSKLGELQPVPTQAETVLKLETPMSGENINSSKPEIIGTAPAGAEITVEIHSPAVITGSATADKKGNFSFSVPSDLPPGEHTVTISTIIDGVVHKVTRTFVVQAAGESNNPAFSATPSATLAPTIRPTRTPTPTITPRPTATPRVTSTPRPTSTSIPTATPKVTNTPRPSLSPAPSTTITIVPTATITVTMAPTLKPSPTPKPQTTLPKSGEADTTWALMLLGAGLIISGWWWYKKSA